jgi:hypothetical protein
VFWFLASFVIYGNDDFPRGMPQQLKLEQIPVDFTRSLRA